MVSVPYVSIVAPLLAALWCPAAPAAPQDGAPPAAEAAEVAPADEARLTTLLEQHAEAVAAKDAAAVAAALVAMAPHDNPELFDAAKDALKYRPSRADRKHVDALADELGLDARKAREALLEERVGAVQAAGARLMANFPGKKATAALAKLFKTRGLGRDRPAAMAATIDALGRLGYARVEDDVLSEYRRLGHPDVQRACVRYFGQVKTRSKAAVRMLCEELAAPAPANPDSPTNPPASYWEERWRKWQAVRRDVTWSLREITGQTFQPDEGDVEGDSRRALAWVKEHERELGLR